VKLFKILVVSMCLNAGVLYADAAKVVYDLSSGNTNKIEKHLLNSIAALSNYYTGEKKSLDVIIVISGNAYKYFIDDLKSSPYASDEEALEIQAYFKLRLKNLHEVYGVSFKMCASGMKARKIKKNTLYEFVEAEKMKSVYLIDAQNDGYAYMPVH